MSRSHSLVGITHQHWGWRHIAWRLAWLLGGWRSLWLHARSPLADSNACTPAALVCADSSAIATLHCAHMGIGGGTLWWRQKVDRTGNIFYPLVAACSGVLLSWQKPGSPIYAVVWRHPSRWEAAPCGRCTGEPVTAIWPTCQGIVNSPPANRVLRVCRTSSMQAWCLPMATACTLAARGVQVMTAGSGGLGSAGCGG